MAVLYEEISDNLKIIYHLIYISFTGDVRRVVPAHRGGAGRDPRRVRAGADRLPEAPQGLQQTGE